MTTNDSSVFDDLLDNPKHVYLQIVKWFLHLPNLENPIVLELSDPMFMKLLETNGGVNMLYQMGFKEQTDRFVLTDSNQMQPTVTALSKHFDEFSRNFHVKPIESAINYTKTQFGPVTLPSELSAPTDFHKQIVLQFNSMLRFRDKSALDKARSFIPFRQLLLNCSGKLGSDETCPNLDELFLYEMLKWFKESFFTWVDKPKCPTCLTNSIVQFLREEFVNERVEVYQCKTCNRLINFHRYKNLLKLLDTREGRCGEWADIFTLLCYSVGFDARFITDNLDHVWTEVFLTSQNRWVHVDSCETALDTPLVYEVGWKKKYSYVIGYSICEVQDVTWRYVTNFKDVVKRRRGHEESFARFLDQLRRQRQAVLSKDERSFLQRRLLFEVVELLVERKPSANDGSGRTSGSLTWRLSRGETSRVSRGHVWTSQPSIAYICVEYNPVTDNYQQYNDNVSGDPVKKITTWNEGAFEVLDIQRKVERDWNMVYLARNENTKESKISWRFKASENHVIDSVDLMFCLAIFESGEIDVELSGDNGSTDVSHFTKYYCPEKFRIHTSQFAGSTCLTVTCKLSGGDGACAWQHTQLFRMSTNGDERPYRVEIRFKRK